MRVLHLTAAATPGIDGRRGVNGPELRTLNSLKYFSSDQVSSVICYNPNGRLWGKFYESGFPLIDLYFKSKYHWQSIFRIVSLINSENIDVLHTQGPASLDLFATFAAKIANAGILVTRPVMLSDLKINIFKLYIYRILDKFTLNNADKIIAVSINGYNHLIENENVQKEKIKLIYNGVELKKFNKFMHTCKGRFGIPHGSKVVGFCAQITSSKGWEDFIVTIKLLKQKISSIVGLIVGDGPLRKHIEKYVKSLNLQKTIIFTGHLDDVRPALNSMDLFLSMSKCEGLSVAIIEAMASGLPCVATNVGGTEELVNNGKNGFIVKVGDFVSAANKSERILTNLEMHIKMSKASRKICEDKFSIERMVSQYQSLYKEVGAR